MARTLPLASLTFGVGMVIPKRNPFHGYYSAANFLNERNGLASNCKAKRNLQGPLGFECNLAQMIAL